MGKDQELLEAARNGNTSVVEKILGQRAKRSGPLASLRRGPGANVQDSSGYSALHHAALNGHKGVVKVLLQHEASTNIIDAKGSSPLHLAAWSGNSEIVKLILSQGPSVPNVNLTTKDNETALHCAAQYGHTDVVAQLLQYGCDPSIRNNRGESAVDLAAQYGRLETVELLVRTHPELIESLRSSSSNLIFPHTPLHLASRNGHRACVEVLLAAGVYVNTRTSAGTAMHEAALCGKMEVVRTLLDRGVDLTIRDSRDNTVLDVLGQFPAHVTHDITAVIKRHHTSSGIESDAESENLPPIPMEGNDSLGSPYENVRSGDELSAEERSSPTQWQLYHKPRDDDHRVTSLNSDTGLYQMQRIPQVLLNTSGDNTSEDQLSTTLPGVCYEGHGFDQFSVCSSSSISGPSLRELPMDSLVSGIYLPMAPFSSFHYNPASSPKVLNAGVLSTLQPTPPKKPPRRNLSVSPTLQTEMSLSVASNIDRKDYDYLFLAHSGSSKWFQPESPQERSKILRRVYHSIDQYVDMKSYPDQNEIQCGETELEPVAITCVHENRPVKVTNPRRKLRRYMYGSSAYENIDLDSSRVVDKSPCSESAISWAKERSFVSNVFLTLKSSKENLLGDRADNIEEFCLKSTDKKLRNVQMLLPTSPTHYTQPPTPDHPPPTPFQAEKSIHECIRPLSQVYKRRSRDMETETEEELLQFPPSGSLDASTGSLSSVTLSDRSISTDNQVEEYLEDVPFAGLLKGSILASERPRTLSRLCNIYSPAVGMGTGLKIAGEQQLDYQEAAVPEELNKDRPCVVVNHKHYDEKALGLMSPFDEQEEWAKISEIMASFGTGLLRESVFVSELEKEFQTRLGLNTDINSPCITTLVGQWLSKLNLSDYESLFVNYGFDDLEFINGVINETDLKEMGISNDQEHSIILNAVALLNNQIENQFSINSNHTVDDWLKSIHLENYAELFRRHLYTDMDRVRRVWEVELAAVLEIQKPGHRKRILASVNRSQTQQSLYNVNGGNFQNFNKDLNTLKTNIQQLKEEICEKLPNLVQDTANAKLLITTSSTVTTSVTTSNAITTNTLKYRKNRPAPQPPQISNVNGQSQLSDHLQIRAPSELLFGVPSTLKTQWRHQPKDLVIGCVTYIAKYLGSTVVKELKGTESTKKSIQKLKNISRNAKVTPDITLSISYHGVRFLNTLNDEPICDHEIRNIHCACQDADDLTHFAYITKDHTSRTHFCHVFCVPTMDQATEIILTLGQAFEVAYQIALKDKHVSHAIRSNSDNQLTNLVSSISNYHTMKKVDDSSIKELNHNDYLNNEFNIHNQNNINMRPKPRSKSITNSFNTANAFTSNMGLSTPPQQQSRYQISSSSKSLINNSNSQSTFKYSNLNEKLTASNHTISINFLTTHDRSHSVNDIKINGNQLNLVPTQDDIGIDVKDMKAGSRAPIALSEEL